MIRFLRFADDDFSATFARITARGETPPAGVEQTVREILADVRHRGDEALLEYTARFDRLTLTAATLEVSAEEIAQALAAVDADTLATLQLAAERIAAFHAKQKEVTWLASDEPDVQLGQGDAARSRRHLCPRRQGGLSLFGADERCPGQGRRRW